MEGKGFLGSNFTTWNNNGLEYFVDVEKLGRISKTVRQDAIYRLAIEQIGGKLEDDQIEMFLS